MSGGYHTERLAERVRGGVIVGHAGRDALAALAELLARAEEARARVAVLEAENERHKTALQHARDALARAARGCYVEEIVSALHAADDVLAAGVSEEEPFDVGRCPGCQNQTSDQPGGTSHLYGCPNAARGVLAGEGETP